MKSFYDLDYIIEMNEKRLEQYDSAYQRMLDKFAHILIVYSAQAIFLVPIVQILFFSGAKWPWGYYLSFCSYLLFFLLSLYHLIQLVLPASIAPLRAPQCYYEVTRERLEKKGVPVKDVDFAVKSSYVQELETALNDHRMHLLIKARHYYKAFIFSLLVLLPFLVCLSFYLSVKEVEKLRDGLSNNLVISLNNTAS